MDIQRHTDPGRIRAQLPVQTAVTATHTSSRALRSCNSDQLVQKRRASRRRAYL